jgi:hypothetical protein
MDEELAQHLEAMEGRLVARIELFEERFTATMLNAQTTILHTFEDAAKY